MRYLVTGITGFLGPHIAKQLLQKGHTVYGLLRGSEQEIKDLLTDDEFDKIIFLYSDIIHFRSIEHNI